MQREIGSQSLGHKSLNGMSPSSLVHPSSVNTLEEETEKSVRAIGDRGQQENKPSKLTE